MKNRLFKNLGWKLGGLLLALILWFHLTTQQQYSRQVTVDIDYVNVPSNLVLANDSQKSAQVELTANGKRLFKILYFEDIKIEVNLSEFIHPGEYSLAFTDDQLKIPSGRGGVEIRYIAPLACDFGLLPKPSKSD